MDLVLKLREIRRLRGLSQKDLARLSGVGEKTISSFETGHRIGSLKISQLDRLLKAYGLTECEFFSGNIDQQVAPWDFKQEQEIKGIVEDLRLLPQTAQRSMLRNFQLMLDTAGEIHAIRETQPAYASEPAEWQMLNSRN